MLAAPRLRGSRRAVWCIPYHTLQAWYRDSATACDHAELSSGESMEEKFKRVRRETVDSNVPTGSSRPRPLFRSESQLPHDQMISYIDEHKEQCGVEAICRVLKQADRGFNRLLRLPTSDHTRSQRKNLRR